jgi:magnesium-transporting ATPase (P-type)
LIGCVAVEDRLQENVCNTIIDLRAAGIGVAMATGDKMETAVNIGYNVGLLWKDTKLVYICNLKSPADGKKILEDNLKLLSDAKDDRFEYNTLHIYIYIYICK